MANLLGLPRELRDEILKLVAFTPATCPPSPQYHRDGHHEWERLAVSGTKDGTPYLDASSVVCQRTRAYGPGNTTLALLLVNKQLHEEAQDLLATGNFTYKLDMMDSNHMYSGPGMWISWLCVPTKRQHMKRIHAQLRLFDGGAEGRAGLVPAGDGTGRFQAFFMSSTYRLFFANFLQHGPGATTVSRLDYEASYSVERFIIDFQRPSGPLVAGPDAPVNMAYCEESVIDPAADELHRWIVTFLQGSQDHQDSKILYQGIGEIEIQVDGEFRHLISLTDSFCRLPNPDLLWPLLTFAHRWEFEAWVHATIERRKNVGMWDESVLQKLRDDGEPECGLLIPGLWWTLLEDDWRLLWRPGTVSHRAPERI